ncbi:hypothetical protein [Paraburkholderia saeva]|uniref:Terminase n=1 Tax=Paraburkholderia saeva TaxID=2777537 RepID=A0A9N8X228_9BURK|nr:hypothetical protein [Paraburkholderia saeva]CAG4901035.1 hypothetical protein LMG31841_02946 [Paraburkholderia saeva]
MATRHEANVIVLKRDRDPWEPHRRLSKDAKTVWREVIAATTADHWAEGDRAALETFCEAVAQLRKLVEAQVALPAMPPDENAARMARSLAREISGLRNCVLAFSRLLRLAPSTRRDRVDRRIDVPTRPVKRRAKGDDLLA